jgi:hypothetical protein
MCHHSMGSKDRLYSLRFYLPRILDLVKDLKSNSAKFDQEYRKTINIHNTKCI